MAYSPGGFDIYIWSIEDLAICGDLLSASIGEVWRSGLNDTVSEENVTGNAHAATASRRPTAARPMAGGGSENRNQRQSDDYDSSRKSGRIFALPVRRSFGCRRAHRRICRQRSQYRHFSLPREIGYHGNPTRCAHLWRRGMRARQAQSPSPLPVVGSRSILASDMSGPPGTLRSLGQTLPVVPPIAFSGAWPRSYRSNSSKRATQSRPCSARSRCSPPGS